MFRSNLIVDPIRVLIRWTIGRLKVCGGTDAMLAILLVCSYDSGNDHIIQFDSCTIIIDCSFTGF